MLCIQNRRPFFSKGFWICSCFRMAIEWWLSVSVQSIIRWMCDISSGCLTTATKSVQVSIQCLPFQKILHNRKNVWIRKTGLHIDSFMYFFNKMSFLWMHNLFPVTFEELVRRLFGVFLHYSTPKCGEGTKQTAIVINLTKNSLQTHLIHVEFHVWV